MIGNLSNDMLDVILDALPLDFSVVDSEDRVVAWNRHDERIFKRPMAALGRNVRDCHPKKSLHAVERILQEMKEGKRETARFWIDMPLGPGGEKQKLLIEYVALRNDSGDYLGCLEVSQNISGHTTLSGEKRLLD
jgi:DUF438 domain-containing protein